MGPYIAALVAVLGSTVTDLHSPSNTGGYRGPLRPHKPLNLGDVGGAPAVPTLLKHMPGLETAAVGQTTVGTPDGALAVDVVEGTGEGKGSRWLRARGVQYAEHPVKHLRWQPPVPLRPHTGTKQATEFGADCVNAPWYIRLVAIGDDKMAEGCLYLNVYAPVGNASAPSNASDPIDGGTPSVGGAPWRNEPRRPENEERLPVMVFFHGGSFYMGGSSRYDGDRMFEHRRDVVLVTVNYRLGALGWMGGNVVQAETYDGSAGNFGLQDTRLALEWVKRNIAAFGGDRGAVTIFGESAGSSIVETHLVAPRSNGLFHRAIMESGPFDNYTVQSDPDLAFRAVVTAAKCGPSFNSTALACLRSLPLNDDRGGGLLPAISETDNDGYFSPAVDGVELTTTPEMYAATGMFNTFDAVMVGSNLNEGRYLMPLAQPVPNAPDSTEADLKQWLREGYQTDYPGDFVAAVLGLYEDELSTLGPWLTASRIYTDSQYLCPSQRSARWMTATDLSSSNESSAAGRDVFVYQLSYAPSTLALIGYVIYWAMWCEDLVPCANMTKYPIGVGHTAELALLWNSKDLNATDRGVSAKLIDYWQTFAATGTPNAAGSGAAVWPPFAHKNTTMDLGVEMTAMPNYDRVRCMFWDSTHRVPYAPHAARTVMAGGVSV